MKNKIIELQDIEKVYETGDENTVALQDINLEIGEGEFVTIMGASGSGKSTLMHIIGLLDTPTSGRYLLDGEDVSRFRPAKQAQIRNRKIGFVFQQFNLLPRTTVLDNVLLPTVYGGSKEALEKAQKIIAEVGLKDRIKYKSNQLAGGQMQRVAIARALIMDPKILLADEPTGNLDSKTSKEIMGLFKKINEDGATVIVITHEEDIAKYGKRIIRLMDGKVLDDKENR